MKTVEVHDVCINKSGLGFWVVCSDCDALVGGPYTHGGSAFNAAAVHFYKFSKDRQDAEEGDE